MIVVTAAATTMSAVVVVLAGSIQLMVLIIGDLITGLTTLLFGNALPGTIVHTRAMD